MAGGATALLLRWVEGPDAVVLPPFLRTEVKQHLTRFAEKGHEDPQPSGGRRADPDWDTLTASTDPDQNLTVWTAAPGSVTRDRLRILASWAADQNVHVPPSPSAS
jgi:hypothetical protein